MGKALSLYRSLPQWGRLRYRDAAFLASSEQIHAYVEKEYRRTKPSPRGEGKEEAASPQKRKPTPPRCARQPLPREGARVDTPSFLWKEVSRRGGGWMGKALSLYRSLPHWGRGTASAVDRVLSLMAHLRRSLLSFIPLVPYPARSARHLPHAGKALFRKYRYPHPTSAPSGHLLPKEGGRMVKAIYPLSVEGGCPKGRGLASFFAAKPPPLCLPHAGKALSIGIVFPTYPVFALTIWG